jgi:methylmalonyl-CoA mutase
MLPSDHLSLAADFPETTRDQWRSLVRAVLRKSSGSAAGAVDMDPEFALASTTYDGITLWPLYTADDAGPEAGKPGRSPFIRGSRAEGAAALGWDVRQRHLDPDPARTNTAALTDLSNGATSLWLVLGEGGLAVGDLPAALDGVYLDLAPIALDAGADTAAAAEAFLRLVDGVPAGEVAGTLGADPIGLRARTGSTADLSMLAALATRIAAFPKLRTATVDGCVYNDAGGSDSDELAIAASVGVAYLRAFTDAGLGIDDALDEVEFRYAVNADQFGSIVKLRAARRIWDRIGLLCGAAAVHRGQRQHAVTSAAMMTQRDPWVNMLRTTIACFAAAVGGAEAITVAPFDSAIGLPDDLARRIARNTQSILHDESSLARVVDAAGGSWYVESRTDQLAITAWQAFTEIERAGGALAALDSGAVGELLATSREQRAANIATRRDPITGVSEFAFIGEDPVTRPAARPAGSGLLPTIRYAERFELLRDRSDAHFASTGARPKIVLAALGAIGAYTGRLAFASNLFQAAGIEPVVATGDPVDLCATFAASGSPVACLCSSDKVYAEFGAAAAKALTEAGVAHLWLAGRPPERIDKRIVLEEAGVDGYLYAGCDVLAVLQASLDELGVKS